MAKRPDTPCAGCGKLLWSGPRTLPAGQRRCRGCRNDSRTAPPPELQPDTASREPADAFGPRGRRLWRAMRADGQAGAELGAIEVVLLEEACRIADRCDRLDALLTGDADAWLRLQARGEDGSIVEVVVDKALSEARQQALALKGLVAELRAAGMKQPTEPNQGASRRDELARRRDERRKAAGL